MSASQYVLRHRQPPPDVGLVVLAEDFGTDEGGGEGGEPMPDLAVVRATLAAIQAECDRDNLRYTPITHPSGGMTKAQLAALAMANAAFGADIQEGLGRIFAHCEVALAELGK